MEADKPWKGSKIPCDEVDTYLFSACTSILLGDGNKAKFWFDTWLNGIAPKDCAPLLFSLARGKLISVREGLTNGRWMRGLSRLDSEDVVHQFVFLWERIRDVHLSDAPDSITWNLNKSGIYTAKSAYNIQFLGRIPAPDLQKVWKFKMEGKVKLFL
ncbi:hypothetical protein BRADI_4g39257v3 [Brachypodium distachyon]|uniref:Reverse transcriptase zinc-binding domain-containing protein n=1 Tax=Brachypodium distachyon TaxID=15368 RepID=A0A2K2CT85_BRADI|nr:hypothetical protein BRADI_4g39257v3 [Brachypodium distachyon]